MGRDECESGNGSKKLLSSKGREVVATSADRRFHSCFCDGRRLNLLGLQGQHSREEHARRDEQDRQRLCLCGR